MFKSWSKKQKIKAVFKLQFQATQVPKLKKPALMISLVPEDIGKPTVRLEKAPVQDGSCFWENPVYETVKLVRENKTGKLNEKIYHFVVSTGTSKSGFVGEASIDFADFEAETEPTTVSLPLKFANSGAILHVSIQKMEGDNDQRDLEENNGALTLEHENSFNSRHSSAEGNRYTTEENNDQNTLCEDAKLNGSSRSNYSKFAASNWGDNHEQNTLQNVIQSPTLRQNTMPTKRATIDTNHAHRRSNTEWSLDSISDGSFGELANGFEQTTTREKMHTVANGSIEKVKNENIMLMRKLEVTELELQSLRKQVTKETIHGQNLSRQIISLTEERDALKSECKQLKFLKKCNEDADDSKKLKSEIKEAKAELAAVGEELEQEKELRANIQLQLQKTQESNSDLVLAVRDLEEMIGLKNRVIADLSTSIESWENEGVQKDACDYKGNKCENKKASSELTREYDGVKDVDVLKQEINDLHHETEIHMKNIEELETHLEQLMEDNEVLKQENTHISVMLERNRTDYLKKENECSGSLVIIRELESQIKRLEDKLRIQTEEFSKSLISINELESQIKGLERNLERQRCEFDDELDAMKYTQFQLEKMTNDTKELLSRTRWKSAIKVVCLQERSKRLSMAMASKFKDNEKRSMKAIKEINELRLQKRVMKEMVQKSNDESRRVKEQNEVRLRELNHQLELKTKEIYHMTVELDSKSKQLESTKGLEAYRQEEIQLIRSNMEIQALAEEKHYQREAVKEQPELSTSEMEASKESCREREIFEKRIVFSNREAEEAHEELTSMRCSRGQQDILIADLQAEVVSLRAQISEFKKESQRELYEKGNLQKHLFQLKGELQNKEEKTLNMENSDFKSQETGSLNLNSTPKSLTVPHIQEELTTSDVTVKLLQDMNNSGVTVTSTSELVEGNVTGNPLHFKTSNKEIGIQEDVHVPLCERASETSLSNKEPKLSTSSRSNENRYNDQLTEMSLLKERNTAMERELKEMEDRYSEISLKFAEVEGERQQLVMTVRNLKNSKK